MLDRRSFLALTAAALPASACAQTTAQVQAASDMAIAPTSGKHPDISIQDLWPGDPPGGEKITVAEQTVLRGDGKNPDDTAFMHVRKPWLMLRKPAKPNGAAVLLAPGGGYVRVAVSKAGGDIDAWLAAQGYTVFTMDYRLPGDPWAAGPEVALQDAQRAIRLLRSRATELGFDPKRVGVMGFSAGGHVAGLLATRFAKPTYAPVDAIDALDAKPTCAALCYPVITMMEPYAHKGSLKEMLGATPSDAARRASSLELNVSADTPPTFVCATTDDPVVPPHNAMLIYDALKAQKVVSELHLYEGATHGFPLRDKSGQVNNWATTALAFMNRHGLMA